PSSKTAQPSARVVHIPCAGVDSRVFAVRDPEAARRSLALDPGGRVVVIAGDGPERGALQARAAAGMEPENVRFLGEISQRDLALWLDAASAFCLPSRNEGTPNVVIEALASGRPVVASRVG